MQRKSFVSLYYFNNTIVRIGENVKGEREYSEFLKNTGVTVSVDKTVLGVIISL